MQGSSTGTNADEGRVQCRYVAPGRRAACGARPLRVARASSYVHAQRSPADIDCVPAARASSRTHRTLSRLTGESNIVSLMCIDIAVDRSSAPLRKRPRIQHGPCARGHHWKTATSRL